MLPLGWRCGGIAAFYWELRGLYLLYIISPSFARVYSVNKHTKKPHPISGKAFLWKNPAAAHPRKAQQHKIMPPTPAETSQHRSGGNIVRHKRLEWAIARERETIPFAESVRNRRLRGKGGNIVLRKRSEWAIAGERGTISFTKIVRNERIFPSRPPFSTLKTAPTSNRRRIRPRSRSRTIT